MGSSRSGRMHLVYCSTSDDLLNVAAVSMACTKRWNDMGKLDPGNRKGLRVKENERTESNLKDKQSIHFKRSLARSRCQVRLLSCAPYRLAQEPLYAQLHHPKPTTGCPIPRHSKPGRRRRSRRQAVRLPRHCPSPEEPQLERVAEQPISQNAHAEAFAAPALEVREKLGKWQRRLDREGERAQKRRVGGEK